MLRYKSTFQLQCISAVMALSIQLTMIFVLSHLGNSYGNHISDFLLKN